MDRPGGEKGPVRMLAALDLADGHLESRWLPAHTNRFHDMPFRLQRIDGRLFAVADESFAEIREEWIDGREYGWRSVPASFTDRERSRLRDRLDDLLPRRSIHDFRWRPRADRIRYHCGGTVSNRIVLDLE